MVKSINDNEIFSKKSINDNVNEEPFVVGRKPNEIKAYTTALKLVEKFHNPAGIRFYYNVALKLSEAEIWRGFEKAHSAGVGRPDKYFTRICLNQLSSLKKS